MLYIQSVSRGAAGSGHLQQLRLAGFLFLLDHVGDFGFRRLRRGNHAPQGDKRADGLSQQDATED